MADIGGFLRRIPRRIGGLIGDADDSLVSDELLAALLGLGGPAPVNARTPPFAANGNVDDGSVVDLSPVYQDDGSTVFRRSPAPSRPQRRTAPALGDILLRGFAAAGTPSRSGGGATDVFGAIAGADQFMENRETGRSRRNLNDILGVSRLMDSQNRRTMREAQLAQYLGQLQRAINQQPKDRIFQTGGGGLYNATAKGRGEEPWLVKPPSDMVRVPVAVALQGRYPAELIPEGAEYVEMHKDMAEQMFQAAFEKPPSEQRPYITKEVDKNGNVSIVEFKDGKTTVYPATGDGGAPLGKPQRPRAQTAHDVGAIERIRDGEVRDTYSKYDNEEYWYQIYSRENTQTGERDFAAQKRAFDAFVKELQAAEDRHAATLGKATRTTQEAKRVREDAKKWLDQQIKAWPRFKTEEKSDVPKGEVDAVDEYLRRRNFRR